MPTAISASSSASEPEAVARELRLKGLDLWTQDKDLAVDNPAESLLNLLSDRLVLGGEVEEGNRVGRSHRGPYLATALSA
jgi:hypothetical protein